MKIAKIFARGFAIVQKHFVALWVSSFTLIKQKTIKGVIQCHIQQHWL